MNTVYERGFDSAAVLAGMRISVFFPLLPLPALHQDLNLCLSQGLGLDQLLLHLLEEDLDEILEWHMYC